MSSTRSVLEVMTLTFAVHIGLSRLITLPQANGRYELLLGVAYFVFGIFSAFAIENARTGMSRVNELLKAGDADLMSIYQLAATFGPQAHDEIRNLIDLHMQDQLDYRLVDFDRSTSSFLNLFQRVRRLDPTSTPQEITYDHLIGVCILAAERRKQLEALTRQRVSAVEWATLLTLFATLWGLMLAANGGPIVASLLGGALVASMAGVMVLLRHLDEFRWQEADAIWKPLHTLFLSLDLLPYYPEIGLRTGRLHPDPGPIRIVTYPFAYPNISDKVVTEIDYRPESS